MKIMPAFLTTIYCIFALSSCTILPAEQTAIVTTDIPATSLSSPTDTDYENTVDLETTDTTEVTYLAIDYPPEYYGANRIMLLLDPLLIRWKDIVEESVTNQICAGKKNENGEWVHQYMDFIAVEIEVLHAYIHDNPENVMRDDPSLPGLFSPKVLHYIWIPYSFIDQIVEGEQAVVMLQEFYPDPERMGWKHLSAGHIFQASNDGEMTENTYPSIIPVVNGRLHLQKEDHQVWSYPVGDLFLYNEWVEMFSFNAPLFGDGMTLEDFSKMMEIVKEYGTP